jgi:putative flippase GtrA
LGELRNGDTGERPVKTEAQSRGFLASVIARNIEFLRYVLVGGTAFLVDYGTFYLTKNFVFGALGDTGVYLATALGFTLGLIYNYILSVKFVFESAKKRKKGKSAGAFALFALIGGIGLALSEAGMYVVYDLAGVHYMLAKAAVSAVVLLWNYAARKILIFR